ncbi:PEP/pyruvate-binding domain-containing protein [Mycobacterium sp. SMC-4]|uniref:PEP/pyruvate-binding domain-containing protein n=1 Tax=Mycobacterium sp. SMC-4 TaxID=2857059 RepID=UPI0021B24598|nr:PEP/pyruvate-binding domain-containing protein [Mycobacterium sp. SMC-4]UXA20182.1 hypothetical protein KXD98_11725 [Mycobacterium sp. SMC-4]
MIDAAVVCRLTDRAAADPRRSGGKGANLAVLAQAGMPIPDGFVVTTDAYRRFVAEHSLDELIRRELHDLGTDPDAVAAASQRLRSAFESVPVPAPVRRELEAAAASLGGRAMAVRSSATAEDLPEASFAGQQDTVLDVVGDAAVCSAVRRCWSSLWSARAIAYRRDHGIGHAGLAVAVVLQPMVSATAAGVLFTADPLSGRRDRMVIEAAAGLGDAMVSGAVTPDRWVIDSASPVPEGAAGLLTPEQLDALVALGNRAAELFGSPQDLEWALQEGAVVVLQSRPITTLFPVPQAAGPGLRVYIPAMLLAQGIAEPLTPAGTAFFRAMISSWIRYLVSGRRPRVITGDADWLPVVAHRIFLDVTVLLQRPRLATRLVANFAMKDPAGSAALRQWLQYNGDRLTRASRPLLPRGLLSWLPTVTVGLVASLVAPARARRRLIARAERQLAQLERRATASATPGGRLDFVDRELPAATCDLAIRQLGAVYGEWMIRVAIERLVHRWLGTSTGFEPVLRWLPHDPTIAMGAALADLARDRDAATGPPAASNPGVVAFLARFGHRAPDREVDLGLPRLADDPTYVFELVNGYRRSGALSAFERGADQARRASDCLIADVRRRRGRISATLLGSLLARHRELGGLRERPKFDMIRAIALGRTTLRSCAESLVDRDLLDDPEDIFFLDPADVRVALAGQPTDLRARARTNRLSFRHELQRRLVPRVLTSDGETVYGSTVEPADASSAALIGTALSPGVHEGVVRILDSPVGARLQPGEVLVAASTDPGWTPLFLLAGALVMEVGGVVSHGALVAREYGIPAVAGIEDAMTRLRTGDRVRVDGTSGIVTRLPTVAHVDADSLLGH